VREGKMRVERKLLKPVLESLYTDSFPSYCPLTSLCKRLGKELKLRDMSPIKAAVQYLADKGLVDLGEHEEGFCDCTITAAGIDKLHGESLI